jgi:cytosine/adenosine deaminase-related metal-dependent hydrolase
MTAAAIAEGQPADMLSLNVEAVPYLQEDEILDQWIFADGVTVDNVWVRGRRQVASGRHRRHVEISRRFVATMRALLGR